MFNPVDLKLRPSRRLAALLWAPPLAALSLLLTSSAPVWLQALGSGIILIQGAWSSWRHGLQASPHAIQRLSLDTRRAPCPCRLQRNDGSQLEAAVAPDSIVTASFVLLRLCPLPSQPPQWGWLPNRIGRSQTLLLCPWNVDPDALRRLRVLLRFAQLSPHSPAPNPAAPDNRIGNQ